MEPLIVEKPRIASLLQHFASVTDFRQPWRVAHPLPEVLLLVVCGTIAAGDDYEEIVDWGKAHLSFLRRFLPFHWGIPCADWLRTLMKEETLWALPARRRDRCRGALPCKCGGRRGHRPRARRRRRHHGGVRRRAARGNKVRGRMTAM